MAIKIVFCDIDGCMGEFVKPDYPFKQGLNKNKNGLNSIKEKIKNFDNVLFGVCTGRSFYQADHIMEHSGHQGPSIFEMGNVIFEPNEGVYNLFEKHEKFKEHIDLIREFIQWKNEMKNKEYKIKELFPESNVRQMKDRICMLTYEFDEDISEELYDSILDLMPDKFKEPIKMNIIKVLKSKNALDILPNINKGDAVTYLIKKYNIEKEEVLGIGDSSHSDLDLLKSVGLIACPDNADKELKNFVLENNGFVAPDSSVQGILSVFDFIENYIKYNQLKNES